ncbi:MAG TPA: type II secretion system F family protein [Sulfuricaulis sp.]|nr:type II secretion system F family protein [Sulfuricaulis sp.]
MSSDHLIFVVMVFIAVFLLATSVIVPTAGSDARTARRLRARVNEALGHSVADDTSIVRGNLLRRLTPLERRIESLPGMEHLARLIAQTGREVPAYRVAMLMAVLGAAGFLLLMLFTRNPLASLLLSAMLASVPVLKLQAERRRRLARFEEQLPEALDVMGRALRAGHPFSETLKLVSEEMTAPIAQEFGKAFADINYGVNPDDAFHAMLARTPSLSLMTVITAVLVQRESGGNLAEILDKIAAVVRGRFRFQRRVRTLSAEGRLSAWILVLIPFVLVILMSIMSPTYLPMMVKDPTGRTLVLFAFVMLIIGIFWIRRIIRLKA